MKFLKLNTSKVKHGTLSAILIAVAVVAVILFNIAASAIAQKVDVSVDLSDTGDFTLSDDIITFLEKDVDRDVTITLCSTKSDYTDGLYQQLLSSYYYGDSSNGTFFKQTIYLLEEIARTSEHITLEYADPLDPSFTSYSNKYDSYSFTMGDILITSEYVNDDGETVERSRLLDINDIYSVKDIASTLGESYVYTYGYSYLIDGNNLETAIGSAIYSVISDKTYKVAVLTANGGTYVDALDNLMSSNNYEFVEIPDLYDKNNQIPADTDVIIISAPTNDYTSKELSIIDDYLSDNSSMYKTVLYIASNNQPYFENINAFLSEWGFTVENGKTLYETEQSYIRGGINTCVDFIANSAIMTQEESIDTSDYFNSISATVDYDYIANNNAVITTKTTLSNNRYVRSLLYSSEGTVAKPNDADKDWEPNKDDAQSYVSFGVGYEHTVLNDYDYYKKRVFVLSSLDFITTDYNSYQECGNLNLIMSAIDESCGKNVNTVTFDTRTFETETFETPSDLSVNVMMIIFVIIIPLVILACCVVIMLKRRHL